MQKGGRESPDKPEPNCISGFISFHATKLEHGNSYVSIYEGLSAKVVLYILDEGKYLYDGCFS
jgi:hypothetical protein